MYYITDTFNGSIVGTNDYDIALELSASEDFFVLCVSTGEWITTDGRTTVKNIKKESIKLP